MALSKKNKNFTFCFAHEISNVTGAGKKFSGLPPSRFSNMDLSFSKSKHTITPSKTFLLKANQIFLFLCNQIFPSYILFSGQSSSSNGEIVGQFAEQAAKYGWEIASQSKLKPNSLSVEPSNTNAGPQQRHFSSLASSPHSRL